eukprot:TRINITY_DN33685_c0_g1_i1.p1 TRINITY_DN33685_c0_g1~~TRINITY_DN33685_c0_g1_i1.p1  ORF type:complete len:1322 (+),score=483.81 TRINITY_DN33685_c0_g1_i1:52-3966(+)
MATHVDPTEMELFTEVVSQDFLNFNFRSSSSYADQLERAIAKTGQGSAVIVKVKTLKTGQEVVVMSHNFGFMGGSLGCAEGEKLVRGFEYAQKHKLPVVIMCKSGGARMQEGTLSLMQMAKVSVAVGRHREAGLPFITVLLDPTYGGVSASYAMQSDVRISIQQARIGFAGPAVILNTMYEMDQAKYDAECPPEFQSAQFLEKHGQLDVVLPLLKGEEMDDSIDDSLANILHVLMGGKQVATSKTPSPEQPSSVSGQDYTKSRSISRPQAQDVITTIFSNFVELEGDGRVGSDRCIRGGLAMFEGVRCVVVATCKGHTPSKMKEANYGMPSPPGYRKALRLMQLAERFSLPVVTFVDTCGALPSFKAEEVGQSEAIATNLVAMAMLKVPIVTVVLGEGGSGGALGIGMGDRIAMMSSAYYGVISPEGAASILGRYKDDADKAKQFPVDCRELATAQHIYASQLKELGVIDEIIWEVDGKQDETYKAFPLIQKDIRSFILRSLEELTPVAHDNLVSNRYDRFRGMGVFGTQGLVGAAGGVPESPLGSNGCASPLSYHKSTASGGAKVVYDMEPSPVAPKVEAPAPAPTPAPAAARPKPPAAPECKLLKMVAEETVCGERSRHKGLSPFTGGLPPLAKEAVATELPALPECEEYAKKILDEQGPEVLAKWVRKQKSVLITDTSMRDAHQSLLATRVRTTDLLDCAKEYSRVFGRQTGAFSMECWGGATFDVAYRFLHECPWDRLRELRKAMPDVCFQMLVRGANAVGYKSYPDNTIAEFCKLAAENGMDVFRIFDCFNDVAQMKVCIDAVREAKKVAEVCICFTGDFLREEEKIYTLEYYKNLAKEVVAAGAHMIGLKDMAGLLKPSGAAPLMKALREGAGDEIPIHFHTHATSSMSLATILAMADAGCDIVDGCIASIADGTSQPSLNAFLADLETASSPLYPKIPYLSLERLDTFWARIRTLYSPFESGMLSGTARVYDHQIPGGQYSNLLVQCKSMGLEARWGEVCDMYRDVNKMFGDIVKVTPSSKCVGDLALYLVQRQMTVEDVRTRGHLIDFPQSSIDLMAGALGFPHRGFPEDIQKIILKDMKPLPRGSRPGDSLPADDFEKVRGNLKAKLQRDVEDTEVISWLLYPKVFDDYLDYVAASSVDVKELPSDVFWYGAGINEEFYVKSAELGGDVKVTLKRVGPLTAGSVREVSFTAVVNGSTPMSFTFKVKDDSAEGANTGPMADPENPCEIGSPMSGTVENVAVTEGAKVEKGDKLVVVGAMKMEVDATAQFAAIVKKVLATKGAKVEEGSLLVVLEKI